MFNEVGVARRRKTIIACSVTTPCVLYHTSCFLTTSTSTRYKYTCHILSENCWVLLSHKKDRPEKYPHLFLDWNPLSLKTFNWTLVFDKYCDIFMNHTMLAVLASKAFSVKIIPVVKFTSSGIWTSIIWYISWMFCLLCHRGNW